MGGPFSFIAGIGCLLGSGISSLVEDNKQELENERRRAAGYHAGVQLDYGLRATVEGFDYKMIIEEIQKWYPNMSYLNAFKLMKEATVKRALEAETRYKYEPENGAQYFSEEFLDYLTSDKFRWK